jgi:hypothetical protein
MVFCEHRRDVCWEIIEKYSRQRTRCAPTNPLICVDVPLPKESGFSDAQKIKVVFWQLNTHEDHILGGYDGLCES